MFKNLLILLAIAFPFSLGAQIQSSGSVNELIVLNSNTDGPSAVNNVVPDAAQDEMPGSVDVVIKWNFDVEYNGDEATIVISVDQKDGWHIYTQVQPKGAINVPTSFVYEPSKAYQLIGKTTESASEEHVLEGFPERYFTGKKAVFKQKIKIKSQEDFKLKILYNFMACKTACFPPEEREIELTIKGLASAEAPDQIATTDTATVASSTAAGWISEIAGTCEGFSYSEIFDPVKVKVFNATKVDAKVFSLSVALEIDSIFTMYAFDNPNGLKSAFTLLENGKIESSKPFVITASNPVQYGETKGYKKNVIIKQEVTLKDTLDLPSLQANLDIFLMGCENDFKTIQSVPLTFELNQSIDNKDESRSKSLWVIFILAFAGGFIALFTPCVFPMIPMTVTFFTKQSKTKSEGIKKASIYSISIVLIYVLLGVIVASVFGATALNDMATNPWVNIAFFALFVIFAFAFLGAFEIRLPSSWVNKADKQADKGGLIGIFFMAFTLALVSFSCTGPIVGSVLVESAQGGLIGPIVAMLGFSTALALPFGLFAAFPGWLNSMPQSGGWLNTVKVTLGFLELAFALKFLSNADLVKQWHLLEREMFLALWIGIFLVLAIYLFGKIQFPHDDEVKKLSVGRGMLGMLVVCFVIYLIPGLFGAPLKWISGFPPPLTYAESPYGIHGKAPEVEDGWPASTHPHGHGINTVRDYYEALAYAKEVGKPLLIDFTGWACVNCRRMEESVWAHESVAPIMADKFIIASLYVDDRGELPAEDIGKPMSNGKKMKTIGDKWMDMQISRYKEVTQPMYVVLDHNENNISGKANYQTHNDPAVFKGWLENALKQFEASKEATEIRPEFEIVK
ncbi:MAG: thioredoxin family protein [Crocinitomicaceae bacterium]|nr:thioredoxin family protein [Crocinitomicaceae bacterium]